MSGIAGWLDGLDEASVAAAGADRQQVQIGSRCRSAADADRQQMQICSRCRSAAGADRQQMQIGSRCRSLGPVFQLSFFASSGGGFNGLEATDVNPLSVSIPDQCHQLASPLAN